LGTSLPNVLVDEIQLQGYPVGHYSDPAYVSPVTVLAAGTYGRGLWETLVGVTARIQSDGSLFIGADPNDDIITIRLNPDNRSLLEVWEGGPSGAFDNLVATIPVSAFNVININTNDGNDTVNIEDTVAGKPVRVFLGSGTDFVNISQFANNLDNIQATVSVTGAVPAGTSTLTVNDQNNASRRTYDLSAGTVNFFHSGVLINYSAVDNLALNAAHGPNLITLSPTAHNLDELPHSFGNPIDPTPGSVTIHGGGSDTLVLNDQNNSHASTWTATGSAVTRSYTVQSGTELLFVAATINYSNIRNVLLNGGLGGNTYTLNNPGPFNLTLNTGSGNNHVNVLAVAGTPGGTLVNIDGNGGNDAVTVGSLAPALGGTLANIYGSVFVRNPTGHTDLLIDDSGDPLPATVGLSHSTDGNFMSHTTSHANIGFGGDGHVFVTYDGGPSGGSVIDFGTPGTPTTLNLQGPETVNVLTTGAPLNINGGGGQDTVNIGNSTNGVAGIAGAVSITNNPAAGGYTALTVDDSADHQGYWYSHLTEGSLTTDASSAVQVAPITFRQTDLSSFSVLLGNSPGPGNIVYVTNTPSHGIIGDLRTTITTGVAASIVNPDQVFVLATTGALTVNLKNDSHNFPSGVSLGALQQTIGRTLDHIQAPVTVNTMNGWTFVGLYDDLTADGQIYTVTRSTVTRSGRLIVTYNVSNNLFLLASRGPNTINVQSTSVVTAISAGISSDTINVGDLTNDLHGIGGLTIQINNAGSQVILNDRGNPDVVTYTLRPEPSNTTNVITRSDSGAVIYFEGPLENLTLNGSNGSNDPSQSDVYNIENTFTDATINAAAASNVFAVTPTSQYLAGIAGPLTLNGTGNDALVFYDRNNPNSEIYTFDSIPSTLSLATLPSFAVSWTGMGSVTLYTNGMSTVIDPSGTVVVDPPGGSGGGGGGGAAPSAVPESLLTQALRDAVQRPNAPPLVVDALAAHLANRTMKGWSNDGDLWRGPLA
jgi:hypothetical protein